MTDDDDRADGPPAETPTALYYRGTIARVYYGSETGIIRSETSGREYRFKWPFVEIRGPIPRIGGLREGMTVGFDLGWTSSGEVVTVIHVEE